MTAAPEVELLSRHGWDGWLCGEYEKRWYDATPRSRTSSPKPTPT